MSTTPGPAAGPETSQRPSDGPEAPDRGVVSRLFGHPATWVALIVVIFCFPLVRAFRAGPPPEVPVLGSAPAFDLVDHSGAPFSAEQLRGKVWVGSVLFTRCPTVCPALVEDLRDLQRHTQGLAGGFRIVSFTADPEHDRPEVLAEYARAHGASMHRWTFLTGEPDEIRSAVVDGLKLGLGEDREAPHGIFHATHLVLVDRQMRVRGYYDSTEPEALDLLLRDIGLVANFGL